jgi:hypothetical protein
MERSDHAAFDTDPSRSATPTLPATPPREDHRATTYAEAETTSEPATTSATHI